MKSIKPGKFSENKKVKTPKSKKKKGKKVIMPTDAGYSTSRVNCSTKKRDYVTRRISKAGDSDSKAREDANTPALTMLGIDTSNV